MTGIETAMLAASLAGTAMSAMGTIAAGNQAKAQGEAQRQAAEFEAKQREVLAGQERAASQRNYIGEIKQAKIASSKGLAIAASSGAGAMDPTVVDLLGDIESEGQYRAMMELYGGEERAKSQEFAATTKRYEGEMAYAAGKAAQKNSRFQAAGQLASGAASAGYMGYKMGMFTPSAPTMAPGSMTAAGSPINRSMYSRYG